MNETMERTTGPKTALVKIERTKTEIRDDVAIRIYTEMVLERNSDPDKPMASVDELREMAQEALTAGFVFFQERYEDKRILQHMSDLNQKG